MRRIILAAVAGAAFLTGATAANAQYYYYDDGYRYGPRGPFVERGVGLQIGPLGFGVYSNEPTYDRYYGHRTFDYDRAPRDSIYESPSYRSGAWYPQSPPSGGGL